MARWLARLASISSCRWLLCDNDQVFVLAARTDPLVAPLPLRQAFLVVEDGDHLLAAKLLVGVEPRSGQLADVAFPLVLATF